MTRKFTKWPNAFADSQGAGTRQAVTQNTAGAPNVMCVFLFFFRLVHFLLKIPATHSTKLKQNCKWRDATETDKLIHPRGCIATKKLPAAHLATDLRVLYLKFQTANAPLLPYAKPCQPTTAHTHTLISTAPLCALLLYVCFYMQLSLRRCPAKSAHSRLALLAAHFPYSVHNYFAEANDETAFNEKEF